MAKVLNWHPMSETEAQSITNASKSPGQVYPLLLEDAPQGLQRMHGAIAYYVSDFITPTELKPGLTMGNEMVIQRTGGATTKAYNYAVATSSDGIVYYNGPYYNFKGHHIDSASSVPILSLFRHTPFSKNANTK
jgi:hypothetical protein